MPYIKIICTKFHINRIKIVGFIVSRRVTLFWHENPHWNPRRNPCWKFPTDCYGKINRYERRLLAFMKKMNEVKYRVSRFARDKNTNNIFSYWLEKNYIIQNSWKRFPSFPRIKSFFYQYEAPYIFVWLAFSKIWFRYSDIS